MRQARQVSFHVSRLTGEGIPDRTVACVSVIVRPVELSLYIETAVFKGENAMKGGWLILVGLAMVAGIAAMTAPEPQQRDGIFIHVSHGTDDPHRVAMALRMAEIMEEQRDVLIYFDIKGIDVCLKSAPDIQLTRMPSSKAQVRKLLNRKVTIMACPACLQAAGKTPEDLAEGIQIADKDKFFTFTKGRILAIDY